MARIARVNSLVCTLNESLGSDEYGDYKVLCLRGKQGCRGHAKVDPDFTHTIQRWHLCMGYASAMPKRGGRVTLHREVLGVQHPEVVDHINGDRLDNRRANLRAVSSSQNKANTVKSTGSSPYKGVSLNGGTTWKINVGGFTSAEQAARVRDEIVRGLFGVHAAYNFPQVGERSALTGKVRRK